MTRSLRTLAVVGLALLAGCEDFPTVASNVCGNGITESGEDCDLAVDSALGDDLACGDPGGAIAARCRYVCDETSCPVGWGCGEDGVCRFASGQFERAGSGSSTIADFELADVNGDGELDVAGFDALSLEISFGDGGFSFSDPLVLSGLQQTGPASAGQLDNDGLLDAAVPLADGVFVVRGQEGGGLRPVDASLDALAFAPGATDVRSIRFRRVPDNGTPPTDASVVLVETPAGLSFSLGPGAPVTAPALAGRSVADLALTDAANVDPLAADSDDFEALVAFRDDDRVFVLSLSDADVTSLVASVSLPPGRSLVAADNATPASVTLAKFADVDNDGAIDIVMAACANPDATATACTDNGNNVAVALGDGLGGFGLATIDTRFDGLRTPGQPSDGIPLAAADFDLDGDTDYVGSNGVFLDDAGTLRRVAGPTVAPTWTVATVGDFNRDGVPDVAAGSLRAAGVDVLRGDGVGFFNDFQVDTTGSLLHLRAGDLDGDLVDDLAITERQVAMGEEEVLSVLFGTVDSLPGSPIEITGFPVITGIDVGFDVGSPNPSGDRILDLVVSSKLAPDGLGQITFFEGTPERTLITTFKLPSPDGGALLIPALAAIGNFNADDSGDVIAVGRASAAQPDSQLWLLEGDGEGHLTTPTPQDAIDLQTELGTGFAYDCAIWLPADLDGDGTHELVAVDRLSILGMSCAAGEAAASILVASVGGTATAPTISGDIVEGVATGTSMADIRLADLDGDGLIDLIVAYEAEAAVVVYWGQGTSFDVAGATTITAPMGGPYRAAAINIDDDPGLELAVLTLGGVFPVEFDADRNAILPEAPVVLLQSFVPSIVGMTQDARLRAGDIDQDGVADLVVADRFGLTAIRSIPHTEVEDAQ